MSAAYVSIRQHTRAGTEYLHKGAVEKEARRAIDMCEDHVVPLCVVARKLD
jgi:hypothetical protein